MAPLAYEAPRRQSRALVSPGGEGNAWAIFDTFREPPEQASETVCGSKCTFCSSGGNVVAHEGVLICLDCNLVADRLIDQGAEWRAFIDAPLYAGTDRTRCGLPYNELLPESSKGTMIGSTIGRNRGHEDGQMRMLRKYHFWTSMPYNERVLFGAFNTLSLSAANHGIAPAILVEAKALYKKASEQGITRGLNRQSLIASSLYLACKRANVPRSAKEVGKMFNIPITAMTRGCKRFGERVAPRQEGRATRAGDFVQRFGCRLGLDKTLRDACQSVTDAVDEAGVVEENSPPCVAASCVYFVCDVKGLPGIDKHRVAEACDISIVSIQRCHKKLVSYVDAEAFGLR